MPISFARVTASPARFGAPNARFGAPDARFGAPDPRGKVLHALFGALNAREKVSHAHFGAPNARGKALHARFAPQYARVKDRETGDIPQTKLAPNRNAAFAPHCNRRCMRAACGGGLPRPVFLPGVDEAYRVMGRVECRDSAALRAAVGRGAEIVAAFSAVADQRETAVAQAAVEAERGKGGEEGEEVGVGDGERYPN